jgi:hypothetical protein
MTLPLGRADRLGVCNALGIAILILAALTALMVVVDAACHSDTSIDKSARLVRVFGFTRLSLVPSGRTSRLPDSPQSDVDWRYDPLLPGLQPDAADLILKVPD